VRGRVGGQGSEGKEKGGRGGGKLMEGLVTHVCGCVSARSVRAYTGLPTTKTAP
jgi:hypothetical protein